MSRLHVRKTYKLYLGGAFARSESGRSYAVHDAEGGLLAHAAQGSRKDIRDAVSAARAAQPGWAAASAYNRGQVLYRVGEVLEGRCEQFVAEVQASTGSSAAQARVEVETAIDRWVWYAGWADKVAQVLGNLNPVAGAFFTISVPEPTGVVGILAPQASPLLGLVSVVAPAIVTGNTAVVITSQQRPLPAISLGEVLATSDVPAGVVNLICGVTAELAPWLAGHREVNAIDLTGAAEAADLAWGDLEAAAAEHLMRVRRPEGTGREAVEPDWQLTPDLSRIADFVEIKTVWHPKGR